MKKVLKQLLSLLFRNKRITLRMIHGLYKGIKLNVCIKNQLGIIFYPNEIHLQNFLKTNLSYGDIALDIGSNIGYTSILTSQIVGNTGHVYSFEPIKETYLILKKNIVLNHCKNITTANHALSDKNGEVEFNIPNNGENSSMSSMVWSMESQNNKKQLIKTVKIDDDPNFKNLSPKTIKIDVEGAEGLVLNGMKQLISRCKPYLYIECTNVGRETTWSILKSLNYSCFKSENIKKEIIDFNLYRHSDFIWIPKD